MPGAIGEMKLEEGTRKGVRAENGSKGAPSPLPNGTKTASSSPLSPSPDDQKTPSDGASSTDAAEARKLSRKPQKAAAMAPKLFGDLPDVTDEACTVFQVINDCLYGSKNMGSTDNDSLDCDCSEEWRK